MAFLSGVFKKKKPILPSLTFNNGQASFSTSAKTPKPALVGSGSPSGTNSLIVAPKTPSAVTVGPQAGKPLLQQGATTGSTNFYGPFSGYSGAPAVTPAPSSNSNALQVGPPKPKPAPTTALAGTPTSTPPPTQTSPSYAPSSGYSMQGSSSGGGFSSYDPAAQASIAAKSKAAEASAAAQRTTTMQPNINNETKAVMGLPPQLAGPSIIDQLRTKIGGLSAPGAEEQALQDQLAQFRGDAQMGIAGLERQGRGIPLGLVRGQQAKLGEQAQLQEQTLMDRLAAMSAQRQAELTAAQNEYTIAANEQARQDQLTAPQTVGNSILRFNPTTGQYETVFSQAAAPQEPTAGIQEYEYAKQGGYTGSFLDYQAALQAQGGSGDGFNLSPGQTRFNADGSVMASLPGAPNELTAAQSKNTGFYNRALAAEQDVQSALPNVANLAQGSLPNFAQGSDYQQYEQAARAWIASILRQESGATIPPDEMRNYMQTYFPRVGDSVATIAQKAKSRQDAMNGLQVSTGPSGGGGDEIDQFLDSFSGDLGKSVNGQQAAKAVATNYPSGSFGAQCGRFVNRLTGLQMGNSYQSKMAYVEPSIKMPKPGYTFVMPYKQFGHTGIVADAPLRPKPDGSFDIPVVDSNWNLDEKVSHHYINSKQISGYVPTTPSAQRVSLA